MTSTQAGPGSVEWRGLRSDLTRRLSLCSYDELRVLDVLLVGLEREREGLDAECGPAWYVADALRIVHGIIAERDRQRAALGGPV